MITILEKACPDCGADMFLRPSRYGRFYGCSAYPNCTATHGATKNGDPLGIPADAETRRARMAAHEAFDRLWKGKNACMNRRNAYRYLRVLMKLNKKDCHIGRMNLEQCQKICKELG